MAQPPAYERTKDFTSEAGSATSHADINAELDAVAATLAVLRTNIALLQRDDTLLKNESVHPNALNSAVLALIASEAFTVRGAWATTTAYAQGDIVTASDGSYVATEAHTSGATFAGDLAGGKWATLYNPQSTPRATTVYKANQSIPNDSYTAMSWLAIDFDSMEGLSWSGGDPTKLVVPAGYTRARLRGEVLWTYNATGHRITRFTRNGTPEAKTFGNNALVTGGLSGSAPAWQTQIVQSGLVAVEAGDEFVLEVYQNSGSSLATYISQRSWLELEVFP